MEDRLYTLYETFLPVCTDVSKDHITGRTSVNRRNWDHLSVYTVDMVEIAAELQQVERLQIRKVVLCTDMCSALMLLKSFSSNSRYDWVNEICETLYSFQNMNIVTIFMWIPAHRGIQDNEGVDLLAKQALNHEEVMEISEERLLKNGSIAGIQLTQGDTFMQYSRKWAQWGQQKGPKRRTRGVGWGEDIGHTGLNDTLLLI